MIEINVAMSLKKMVKKTELYFTHITFKPSISMHNYHFFGSKDFIFVSSTPQFFCARSLMCHSIKGCGIGEIELNCGILMN